MNKSYDVYMCREKSRQQTAKSELLEHFRRQMEAGMHMSPIKDEAASKVVFVMLITLAVIIGWMLY